MKRALGFQVGQGAAALGLVLLCVGSLSPLAAQDAAGTTGYRVPPPEMVAVVDAAPTPGVSVDPGGDWMLLLERRSLPPLSELAQTELRLGGLRLNPATHGPSRGGHYIDASLSRVADGVSRAIVGLPPEPRISQATWSPNGRFIAMTQVEDGGISLWLAEVESGRAHRLTEARLNAVFGSPCQWLPDSQGLLCRRIPKDLDSPPQRSQVPTAPIVQENLGRTAPARTYQDLLKDSHDEALFEFYATSEIIKISVQGTATSLGVQGLIRRASASPDGRYLLVESMERPFSYLVPFFRFPNRVEVRGMDGALVRTVAQLPLAEEVPIARDGVPTGPRSFAWRRDADATLVWAEAQDGGDPRNQAEVRDRLFTLEAPFEGEPKPLVSLGLRYSSVSWGTDDLALVSEGWWSSRQRRVWRIQPASPQTEPVKVFDYSFQDRYRDPGFPLTLADARGQQVLLTSKKGQIYLAGAGASPEGDRPFLDELDLSNGSTKRLWRSEAPYYEQVLRFLDPAEGVLLTRRESQQEPPNYFLRRLGKELVSPLTHFPHPTPQLTEVTKELIRYPREDGLQLTATLYLPAGYRAEDGPLPVLMWAYPREFKSADAASQVTGSPHRFVRVASTSPLLWLTQGYAVLDNPSMPIVGEGQEEPNDTYVEQLVMSARAAVDELVRRGVADRRRIAIGGHSYGAFMTANLLAHSDLFRAGIARSGAYNRTLTPFGFQSEERTFWEAPQVYFEMSPFMHADQVNEPLLLIHGQADNNSGTFPMQSDRYYSALKGFGATVRLVMLPHESHGYQSRESVLHVLWETHRWLEKYVATAPAGETPSSR